MSSTDISHRLAAYGTLAPVRPHHHHLEQLQGQWSTRCVRGHLSQNGGGAALGVPALIYPPPQRTAAAHCSWRDGLTPRRHRSPAAAKEPR